MQLDRGRRSTGKAMTPGYNMPQIGEVKEAVDPSISNSWPSREFYGIRLVFATRARF